MRRYYQIGLVARLRGEGEEVGFMLDEVGQNAGQKAGLGGGASDFGWSDAGQRQETLDLHRVAGDIGERLGCDSLSLVYPKCSRLAGASIRASLIGTVP